MALLDIRGIEMRRSDRLRLDARTKYTRLAFKLDPLSKPTNDAKLERTVDGEIVAGTAAESERVDRVGITKTDLGGRGVFRCSKILLPEIRMHRRNQRSQKDRPSL